MTNKLVKKMTPKTILGVTSMDVPTAPVDLYDIYGVATKTKSGESTYGTWTALVGNFEAIVTETGALVSSSVCFLPEPVHSMIIDALGDNKSPVEFAVHVMIIPNSSAIGYEYIGEPLTEAKPSSQLAMLREVVKTYHAKLPAPKSKKKLL